jgi:hypothetical protein
MLMSLIFSETLTHIELDSILQTAKRQKSALLQSTTLMNVKRGYKPETASRMRIVSRSCEYLNSAWGKWKSEDAHTSYALRWPVFSSSSCESCLRSGAGLSSRTDSIASFLLQSILLTVLSLALHQNYSASSNKVMRRQHGLGGRNHHVNRVEV